MFRNKSPPPHNFMIPLKGKFHNLDSVIKVLSDEKQYHKIQGKNCNNIEQLPSNMSKVK